MYAAVTIHLSSPADLLPAMPRLLEALAGRRKIALYGDMGAGKTTLVKALCAYLGVESNTASPTFSLINQYRYRAADGSTALFHHLDLYRLNSPQEAFDIGLEDLLYDPWYCVMEWPQLAETMLPEGTARVEIKITGEESRTIEVLEG